MNDNASDEIVRDCYGQPFAIGTVFFLIDHNFKY